MIFTLGTETPNVLGEVTLTVWCWDDGNRWEAVAFESNFGSASYTLCDPRQCLGLSGV